jgi:signal transduction histidine kinase
MVLNFDKENRFQLIWAYSLVSILVIIVSLYFTNINIGIENFSNTVSLPVYTVIPGAMVLLSVSLIIKGTIPQLDKKSLIFLTAAFCCWFLAEQTWNLYEHVLEIDPYPSVADFFYISAPIFMFFSLFHFLKTTKKSVSLRQIIFASLISLAILVPTIVFAIDLGDGNHFFENAIALAYPIADAVLLVPAIISFSFLISKKKDFFWLMIISGIIMMLAADTTFLFLVINDRYVDGHPVDILWVASYTIWTFMLLYVLIDTRNGKETNKAYQKEPKVTKRSEKYGVVIGLALINSTVFLLLYGINYFIEPRDDNILEFFSWILAMMVIIFSSMIVLLNLKLNKKLENRTAQLEEASREVIKNERFSAIGELASRISHDIRNPLSNIFMSIELLKNSPPGTKLDDQKISEKLEMVSKNVERISHQINDVLGFVKNQQLNKTQFNITSCIKSTLKAMNIPNNIQVIVPSDNIKLYADEFQIQTVFNNIIVNAIQAIGKERGEIIFRIFENSEKIKIEIENNGPEIPKEVFPHIFDSLVTTKQIGTGLGLVSCKTILENHNGTIYAQNNPTRFIINLPKNNHQEPQK